MHHRSVLIAVLTVCSLLWLGGTVVMARIPTQKAKDPAATELAGIVSYHLTDPGGEANLIAVDAFDVEDQPLASCELEWFEDSKTMTCIMPDGGRFQATWYEQRAEFADLGTGDHVSIHREGVADRGASDPDSAESPLERREWVAQGTKTLAEVERDWGDVMEILGYLAAEVEMTLGMIPGDRLFLDRRIYLAKEPKQSGLPLKIDLCNGGPSFCDSNDVCEISGILGTTPNHCCSKASRVADACCRTYTLLDCCANSVCSSVCFPGFCECYLDGWKTKCGC